MEREGKPPKPRIETDPPVARKSRGAGHAPSRQDGRHPSEARAQLAAISEVLRVISRSQTDVQPVFDTIVRAAMQLCRAQSANVFTFDGELVHLAANLNVDPA